MKAIKGNKSSLESHYDSGTISIYNALRLCKLEVESLDSGVGLLEVDAEVTASKTFSFALLEIKNITTRCHKVSICVSDMKCCKE